MPKKKPAAPRKRAPRKKQTPPSAPDLAHIAEPLRPLAEPIDKLVADPGNARTHDEENLAAIQYSLDQYGQRKPVVANRRTGQLEAGHGTLEAAGRLGWQHLAVVWVDDDPATASGFALADNRSAELADWDQLRLSALLTDLKGESEENHDALYDAMRLGVLLSDSDEENPDDDQADDDKSDSDAQLGDLEFRIIVLCENEQQQGELLGRFEKEGLDCQALIS